MADRDKDLTQDVGLSENYVRRRTQGGHRFCHYLDTRFQISLAQLAISGILLGYCLRGYGQHLYHEGYPLYFFQDSILFVQHSYLHWKSHLGPAWQLLTRWQQEEPGGSRIVMPPSVLKAMVSVALLWNWPKFAAALLLGFSMMLHPAEFLTAVRKYLLLPSDILMDVLDCYLYIREPKTRRYARRQHGKCSDTTITLFLQWLYRSARMDEPLYPLSSSAFRTRWNCVLDFLGIPRSLGVTPGILRGSGATFFNYLTEDINRIAWRGRWRKTSTLEFYLQEVAAQTMLNELPSASRARVKRFSDCCYDLLVLMIKSGVEYEDFDWSRVSNS